ncbi:MAG: immunoglobulin domain-containing protein, partial [Prevotella sp.]|jgi:hypothetical protein|nr:immunoglobulin domain-containing protein [Prevotella sp.]
MPHLTSGERDALSAGFTGDAKAQGLTVYNTDTKCYEYWNSQKWVSLCNGIANITLSPSDELPKDVPVSGYGPSRPITPKDEPEPSCGNTTPYTIGVVSGANFVSINLTDQSTGTFTYIVDENLMALPRTAVIRITNNCTGEYREFLITQDGNTALCDPAATKPVINATNGGTLCTKGSVILTVAAPQAGKTYVWAYKGNEVGRGVWYAATKAGDYAVYVGAIGCETNRSASCTVTTGGNMALPGVTVVASNNGHICGTTGYTTLVANSTSASGLRWFKNGILQIACNDQPVVKLTGAGQEGEWFAAMGDAQPCLSTPSNIVTVTYDGSATPLPVPVVTVNGNPLASAVLCSNGQIDLAQTHDYSASSGVGVTVKWYLYTGTCLDEGCKIGEGSNISITTPNLPGGTAILSCVVEDNTGSYCSREVTETKTLSATPAPASASITGKDICGSVPATLTANASADSYRWYKNGSYEAGLGSGQTVTTSEVGTYQVSLVNAGGCRSSLSGNFNVSLSDFPTLVWVANPATAEPLQSRTFSVSASFSPTAYTWTLNQVAGTLPLGAGITTGQGSPTVGINFPKEETVGISVTAVNGCGSNYAFSEHQVSVVSACVNPQVMSITPLSGIKLVGSGFTLTVSATGSAPLTYTWKKGGTELVNAANHISGQGTNTLIMSNLVTGDGGMYTCEVSNLNALPNCSSAGGTATGTAGSVTVVASPAVGDPGKGLFIAGETCFDVNAGGNNNSSCGTTASRAGSAMNLSSTYTYTFRQVTANRSLQFLLEDAVGAVELVGFSSGSGDLAAIPAGEPAATLTAINAVLAGKPSFTAGSTYSITLKFKSTLNWNGGNPSAYGTTNSNPVVITLSALYEDNASTLRMENKVISIKDCSCCGNPGSPGTMIYNGVTYRTAAYATGTGSANQCWMITPSQVGKTNLCNVAYTLTGFKSTPSDASVCPTGWRIPTKTEASRLNPDLNSSYWYKNGWVVVNAMGNCQPDDAFGLRMVTTDNTGYYWNNSGSWEWRPFNSNESIQVRCIRD